MFTATMKLMVHSPLALAELLEKAMERERELL